MSLLKQGLDEARNGTVLIFTFEYEFRLALQELWEPEPPAASYSRSSEESSESDGELEGISFSLIEPEPTAWSIAFTSAFRKSVAAADRTLQGRVLEALSDLSETPVVVRGDTKKPLVGKFKGLWRVRVGNYRLVYEPQHEKRLVILVDFGARGGAYEL